jgi:class 3 adenylate cyclase
MLPDLPTGTVTFLFTDVEGSTRLLEEVGDEAYEEALSVHRRIVRAACQAHDGVEVDTQGDAFFFAFPEPSGALAAAQQMTERLAAGPIQVRVGLHNSSPRRCSSRSQLSRSFADRVTARINGVTLRGRPLCARR